MTCDHCEHRYARWKLDRGNGVATVLCAPCRRTYLRAPRPSIPEPGRNEPCPCGSGVKHKRCCDSVGGYLGTRTA